MSSNAPCGMFHLSAGYLRWQIWQAGALPKSLTHFGSYFGDSLRGGDYSAILRVPFWRPNFWPTPWRHNGDRRRLTVSGAQPQALGSPAAALYQIPPIHIGEIVSECIIGGSRFRIGGEIAKNTGPQNIGGPPNTERSEPTDGWRWGGRYGRVLDWSCIDGPPNHVCYVNHDLLRMFGRWVGYF